MANTFVMYGLFYAHRAMVRDIALLDKLAARMETFSIQQRRQIKNWYEFIGEMMEQHHHAEDDLLFFKIEERMRMPSHVVEVMEEEHHRIQFIIDEIRRLLNACDADVEQGKLSELKTELKKNTAALVEVFGNHISKEEEYVQKNITQLFTEQEQKQIERRLQRVSSMKYMSLLVPWMKESLTQDEYNQLLQSLSFPARLMNNWMWNRRYKELTEPIAAL